MRLLSGSTRFAIPLVLFVLATMLPVSWSSSGTNTGLGVTSAWAGSPDETLNPPPQPPKKGGSLTDGMSVTSPTATVESARTRTGWSWTESFGLTWNYYLSKVLRF